MRLAAEELYRLRRAQLLAQRKALEAQEAELCLRGAMLEIEQQYGLLAREATLDLATGEIREATDEPFRDADPAS